MSISVPDIFMSTFLTCPCLHLDMSIVRHIHFLACQRHSLVHFVTCQCLYLKHVHDSVHILAMDAQDVMFLPSPSLCSFDVHSSYFDLSICCSRVPHIHHSCMMPCTCMVCFSTKLWTLESTRKTAKQFSIEAEICSSKVNY